MANNVISLVTRRKITALEKNIQELTEVTTIVKTAMQGLGKYTTYSNVRNHVNELFLFYKELKDSRDRKIELLERLKNEELE